MGFIRSQFKRDARGALRKYYGLALLVCLFACLIEWQIGDIVHSPIINMDSLANSCLNFVRNIIGRLIDGEFYTPVHTQLWIEQNQITFDVTQSRELVILSAIILLLIIYSIYVKGPFLVGINRFFLLGRATTEEETPVSNEEKALDLSKSEDAESNKAKRPKLRELFFAFKNNYRHCGVTMFLSQFYVVLWMLLFLVPEIILFVVSHYISFSFLVLLIIILLLSIGSVIIGTIKELEYSMIPFLLAENPKLERQAAFRMSKAMTMDFKRNMFLLRLSFIPWRIVALIPSALTFGASRLLLSPYIYATKAEMYVYLKEHAIAYRGIDKREFIDE
ncbi:MAG: DUF975 family protein [Oscillospiraceae bacterium]|jgi:uncharacterized membrane protein|nr:DUF975 family protein [Oscillospiraceae bacterium]